jgi:hypothetical protein
MDPESTATTVEVESVEAAPPNGGQPWGLRLRRLIVEFLVLFLAVSLSFVAEDFRESLGERREERVVLESIRADLLGDLPIVRSIGQYDSAAAVGAQWLHANWDRPALPSDSVAAALQAQ